MKKFLLVSAILFFTISSCDKADTYNIVYPEFSNYGENVLFENKLVFGSNLSLSADLSKNATLTIVITGGLWDYRVMPNGPINWFISTYEDERQTFTSINSDERCDLSINFQPGTHTIEYYENGASTPTETKTFTN